LNYGPMISQADERSRIWHEQLEHLNFRNLKMMVTQNMVVGLPKVLPPDGVCKGCVLGKHHQAPFDYGNAWPASNLFELVHSELCCINKPSLAGAGYVFTFIDDLSHYNWVYFLKNKNRVFERFKEFRTLAEKQCGRHVKCLRSNNGGKYVSRQFEDYLVQSDISWKRFVPHTPQQNGIAGRKNITLVEMSRCLLQAKDLQMKFWVEAVYCVNYLLN
jgi:hypothetical protein